MREILFRGKRKDNGEWVYGAFINARDVLDDQQKSYIIWEAEYFSHGEFACVEEVIPETIGQYTGLCDKNGTKIFEGDILNTHSFWNREPCVVRYGEGTFDSGIYCYTGFYYEDSQGNKDHTSLYENIDVEIIGNIHDNNFYCDVEGEIV